MNSYIKGSAYYVPEGKLTHEELVNRFGSEQVEKIAESSGIYERRVVKDNECASDLAMKAAEELIEALEINPKEIETLLFATQTPDYLLPTTACILQDRLGLPKTAAVFDINLGCSQYVYALMTGHSMIVSGVVNNALILTGDTVSRIINPMDRSVVPLFGDAGTATYLKKSKDNSGFLSFDFGSDGSGFKNLIWPTSGLRQIRDKQSALELVDKSVEKIEYSYILKFLKKEILEIVKSQNIIDIDTPSFLNVNFSLNKKNDLFLFQNILSEVDLIENFSVKEFNNKFAYINIKYYGKINKIKEKLIEKGLDLNFIDNKWSARLR